MGRRLVQTGSLEFSRGEKTAKNDGKGVFFPGPSFSLVTCIFLMVVLHFWSFSFAFLSPRN